MNAHATRLALDCSFAGLSLALQTASGQVATFTTPTARSSDFLPQELANIFEKSGINAMGLTHILVTTGPGSFTGIRLGLATAEALKLLKPSVTIIGLSTLQALACQVVAAHAPKGAFTLVLDAAGQQAYTQTFSPHGEALTPAACVPLSEVSSQPNLFAQASLMLPGTPLSTLDATHLFTLAENPAHHLHATPVYLKPLTYKLA